MLLFEGDLCSYVKNQKHAQEMSTIFHTRPGSKDPAADWIQPHYDWNWISADIIADLLPPQGLEASMAMLGQFFILTQSTKTDAPIMKGSRQVNLIGFIKKEKNLFQQDSKKEPPIMPTQPA